MIVIIGCSASSGSTVLARLLDCHPEIACGRELYLFSKPLLYDDYGFVRRRARMVRWLGLSSGPLDEGRAVLKAVASYGLSRGRAWSMLRASASLVELAERFRMHLCATTGKAVWAEKTPANVLCFARFLAAFPHGRVIHLVRDPRDSMLSIMRRGGGCSAIRAAETWLTRVAAGHAVAGDPRVLEVRYEDLVRAHPQVMEQVCGFIGVSHDPSYFESRRHASRGLRQFEGHATWGIRPDESVSESSVGKHLASTVDLGEALGARLTGEYAAVLGIKPLGLVELAERYGYRFDPEVGSRHPCRGRVLGSRRRRWLIKRWFHDLVDAQPCPAKIEY